MNVASLQTFLHNQARFLADAGAAKTLVGDFETLAAGLEPFGAMKLIDLCQLLQQAHEYRTTGVLPVKPGRAARAPKAPRPSAEEQVRGAAQRLAALYERALDPGFRHEDVDAELARLNKMTIAQLKSVAGEFDVVVPGKAKKSEIVEALGRKVSERRAFHARTQINAEQPLDPPAATASANAAVQGF
jgi:hypothetical protein